MKLNALVGPVAAFSVIGLLAAVVLVAVYVDSWHKDSSVPPMPTDELISAIEHCGRLRATVEVHTDRRDRPQWVSCYWSSQDVVEWPEMIGDMDVD